MSVGNVPILSIVGTIMLSVLLLVLMTTYLFVRKMHLFFGITISGILVYLIFGIQVMISYQGSKKANLEEREKLIQSFETCPDYWTMTNVGDDLRCNNEHEGIYLGKTGDVQIEKQSFSLNEINEKDPATRCMEAESYSWTEAINKCGN